MIARCSLLQEPDNDMWIILVHKTCKLAMNEINNSMMDKYYLFASKAKKFTRNTDVNYAVDKEV